ncbi:activated protein kinase catalytic subunit alpha-1 [Seminavis robusta]|uniref:guanylate cyclase n=1 Tax=Seminavis robusta TaxID=568900 RepID=A0A9N8HG88_9STRA|nr:activated protein kinase catalytic subunit alpha-1 [Seminavis robusta]|eukprot:Sro387_g132070.1 activated protein kinase catalytic subunit alpha-1 (1358) ;mRNA; f:27356-32810
MKPLLKRALLLWVTLSSLVISIFGHGDVEHAVLSVAGQSTHYSDTFNISRGPLSCTTVVHQFNPRIHKPTYRVGVYASEGEKVAFQLYGTLFSDYLTETAGKRFNPPVAFELVPVSLSSLMELAENENVDFMFSSSSVFSCMATEYQAQPLATIINRRSARGYEYDLDVYGGVMFVLKDNEQVNSIEDFKGRTIGAGSITAMGGGQTQFYELFKHGLSYVADPKQVIFTKDERLVVQGLLDGDFEIGFARTDQIERHTNEDGEMLNDDAFKIINPHTHVLHDGKLFPFVSSTSLHPEWPVAALDHVDPSVAIEVQEALFAIRDHAMSLEINNSIRCDTTARIAQLAVNATTSGRFVGFRTARSYFQVRTKQEAAGFIQPDKDKAGDLHCIRGDTLYQDIECPTGHYKVTEDEFNRSCELVGLPCKDGYECYCQPCVQAFEVDVYNYSSVGETTGKKQQGCDKMSLCGEVQQIKEIVLHMFDNLERADPTIHVIMHLTDRDDILKATKLGNHTYEIRWSENKVGVGIVEIFFDGKQIPESPLRVQVVTRDCEIDYSGRGMTVVEDGNCHCGDNTIEVGEECVDVAVFAIVGAVVGLLIILIGTIIYMRYRAAKTDEIWQVHAEELHLDDPVEVIGQGSFGVVLLAEYRGTKVAMKRVLKSSSNRRNSSKNDTGTRRTLRSGFNAPESLSSNISIDGVDTSSSERIASPDSDDIEAPDSPNTRGSGKTSSDIGSGSTPSSRHFSVGFLTREFTNSRSKWAMKFPWLAKSDFPSQKVHDILGKDGSHASATRTMAQVLCLCFNEHSRRIEEFKTEMRVLARLRHPCITTVMGAVITPHRDPVMVMEYMEYGSLHDLLRNETMLLAGEIILPIIRDLAQGLRFLHSSKPPILHGDLKARNILIDGRFRAKLCDFGLSNKRASSISGTPFWLAPEYLTGMKHYNTSCDIYSVGIIIWEIYARKSPYEGENFKDVIRGVCNRRINKRPKIPLECPPKFVEIMQKCWSPDAPYRPAARNLDVMVMELSAQDAEPITEDDRVRKQRAGDLLNDIFPKHVADALKEGNKVEPEKHDMVTVIFSDIVSFTDISRQIGPEKVCDMLDRLYLKFDTCARKHNVFKVETIGDAWMGVTNLEGDQDLTHVRHIAEYAIDMVNLANTVMIDTEDPTRGFVNIRVGFHSGSVVSNVIGSSNKRYCLFGDTVNTASRMESNSVRNRILCSHRSYKLLKDQAPSMKIKCRGKIEVKGKGQMYVFWVGDNMLHARRHLKEKSVDFDFSNDGSMRDLFEPSESSASISENDVDAVFGEEKRRQEHANDQQFMNGLDETIDEIDEGVKMVNNALVSAEVIVNYQDALGAVNAPTEHCA